MSGLIGKAMRFARSRQGKQAIAKAQAYVKSPEGREKLDDLKERVTGKEAKKPAAEPAPEPGPAAREPRPDPDAPTP